MLNFILDEARLTGELERCVEVVGAAPVAKLVDDLRQDRIRWFWPTISEDDEGNEEVKGCLAGMVAVHAGLANGEDTSSGEFVDFLTQLFPSLKDSPDRNDFMKRDVYLEKVSEEAYLNTALVEQIAGIVLKVVAQGEVA